MIARESKSSSTVFLFKMTLVQVPTTPRTFFGWRKGEGGKRRSKSGRLLCQPFVDWEENKNANFKDLNIRPPAICPTKHKPHPPSIFAQTKWILRRNPKQHSSRFTSDYVLPHLQTNSTQLSRIPSASSRSRKRMMMNCLRILR